MAAAGTGIAAAGSALAAAVALWLLGGARGELPLRGNALSPLPPLPDPGPCRPPPAPSAAGPKAYRRFFRDDALVGRPINCSREQKTCFRYNLLYHIGSSGCQPVGGGLPHGCDLRVDAEAFKNGSGRLLGACATFADPCPGFRMAADGRCYRKETVRDVVCGCGARPVRHVAGGAACRSGAPQHVPVRQPAEEGRCRVPDLRFPDVARAAFFANPHAKVQGFEPYATGLRFPKEWLRFPKEWPRLACDRAQARCFADGLVALKGRGGCHRLLHRGPCPVDTVVALNATAALRGRAEGVCVHVRGGCGPLTRRMVFGGGCLADRDLQIAAPGGVAMNQFGDHIMMPHGMYVVFEPRILGDGQCEVHLETGAPGPPSAVSFAKPSCGGGDTKWCHLYQVEAEAPLPD